MTLQELEDFAREMIERLQDPKLCNKKRVVVERELTRVCIEITERKKASKPS